MRLWCTVLTGVLCSLLAPLSAQSPVTMPNPDFELDEMGWTLWPEDSRSSMAIDESVAHSGRMSLRVTATEASDRAIVNTVVTGFETGVVYRICIHVLREPTVDESAVSYFINYRGGEDGAIQQRAYPVGLRKVADGDWVQWSGLFAVPEGITQWQFCLGVEYTVGRVWFDDIRVDKVGPAAELTPDVWSYVPLGVEIGEAPLSRFSGHKADNGTVYQMAGRYNGLLMQSAQVETSLRELERCLFYQGRSAPVDLSEAFRAADEALNIAYIAYGTGFRAGPGADWSVFTRAAEMLQAVLDSLGADIDRAREALGEAPGELPRSLGRQALTLAPFNPDGSMNRLLFGAWSPTQWSEFEKPFDLEFHSSAPGHPRVHTETELDFSNITEACDSLEALGYSGTFGYLLFGIHDSMYAPQWLLDKYQSDPDFLKTSRDGLQGSASAGRACLNYFHPAVRRFTEDYLGRYAEFCKSEPRVLFHETSQEAYSSFSTEKGRRESGYGPSALQAFHRYLQGKYPSIAALNEAWDSDYESFAAIEPPADGYVEPDRELTPLVAEFEAFRQDGFIDYLKLVYDSLKAGDPGKPVVARHSALLGDINGARIFETCDVLSYHNRAPNMQLAHVYLNSLSRFHNKGLGYMEDFWGVQEDRGRVDDEKVQRRALERHISRSTAWGRTLQMKWYAYTSGSYLLTYNGNWFDPRYDVTTMRYCAPALAVAKRRMERLDWVLTHSRIPASRVLVLQPSASMRNELPRAECYATMLAMHALLYPNGVLYEIVPEEYFEEGKAAFGDYSVVFLPRARCLSAGLQEALADFTEGGGLLVACGEPGVLTQIARPGGTLCSRLESAAGPQAWARVRAVWDAEGEAATRVTSVGVPCGAGRLEACGAIAQLPGEALRESVNERAPRMAHAVDGNLEVVPRVAEDGGLYLFLLNPSSDSAAEDLIELSLPVTRAVDVSLPEPIEVPVAEVGNGRFQFRVRLGAGESAVIWVEGE